MREESESFEVECESKKCTLEQRHMAITLSAGRFGVENRWPEQSDGERLAWSDWQFAIVTLRFPAGPQMPIVAPGGPPMADLSTLIQASLAEEGETAEANAFSRLLGKALAIELDQHTVREAKGDLSGFLGRVRGCRAMTIAPHRRLKDAVVMISLTQLAKTLGAVAADFEQSPAADAHDPMMMFTAVDRLPEVSEAEAVVARRPRRKASTLNLE